MLSTVQATLVAFALSSSPAEALEAAVADVQTLPEAARPFVRYLSLYNVPHEDRAQVGSTASYVLNAVSQARVVNRPTLAAGGELLRVDLTAWSDITDPESYKAVHQVWEKLAAADPYWHLRTQVATQEGLKIQTVPGGWAGLEAAQKLQEATGSFGALLRADWFIAKVTTPPIYYDWLGIKGTEADFLKDQGVNATDVNRLAADRAANIGFSKVTGKPRRIIYKPSPLGGVWITKDVANDAGDKDPFRSPVNFKEQKYNFDATEVFYLKANGFWGTALFNAKGERQDAVPPNIATDTTAPAGHQELVPLISCIRCHELNGGKSGLQPFKDEQTLLSLPDSYELSVSVRIRELYDPVKLEREVLRDGEDYDAAVFSATGLKSGIAVENLSRVFGAYAYEKVTPDIAATELGIGVDDLRMALKPSTDPTTKAILLSLPVTRGRFEIAFQDMALHAANYLQTKGTGGPP